MRSAGLFSEAYARLAGNAMTRINLRIVIALMPSVVENSPVRFWRIGSARPKLERVIMPNQQRKALAVAAQAYLAACLTD